MWPSRYCTGLKHLCDCGTNNYIPIWLGIKSEISHATEGFCAYLKSSPHKPYGSTTSLLLIHQCKWPVSSIIAMIVSQEVARNLRDLTKRSRDILHKAKGITGIESTQIRWFSRWSGGGGWSSRAKLSGGQESQTKGQGIVQLPPQWATTEAARRGARGP